MQKEILNVEHLHLSFVNFFNADFTSGRTSLKSSLFSCRSRRRFGGHDAPAISFCASSTSMTVGRVLSSVWGVGRLLILWSPTLSNLRGMTRAKRSDVGCICFLVFVWVTLNSIIGTDDECNLMVIVQRMSKLHLSPRTGHPDDSSCQESTATILMEFICMWRIILQSG